MATLSPAVPLSPAHAPTSPWRLEKNRDGSGRVITELHPGQMAVMHSQARFVAMIAGTQGGKTSLGPLWLEREIRRRGPGDYLAVTATFPLLMRKMLPEFLKYFQHTMRLGWYSKSDKTFHFQNEETRIMFGSASNPESLESATAKAAWLDECVGPDTLIETEIGPLLISDIVNLGLRVRVWSYDSEGDAWKLRPISRWVRRRQTQPLLSLGRLRLTGNHRLWTREAGYVESAEVVSSGRYTLVRAESVPSMRAMPGAIDALGPEALLLDPLRGDVERNAIRVSPEALRGVEEAARRAPGMGRNDLRVSARALRRSLEATLGPTELTLVAFGGGAGESFGAGTGDESVDAGRQWPGPVVATGNVGERPRLEERVRRDDGRRVVAPRLQDRRGRADAEGSYRSREPGERPEAGLVRAEWVDVPTLLQSDGRDVVGGLSSDGCVYNLEVDGNHNYVAGGLLVANCGQSQFRLESWEAIQRRVALYQGRVLMTSTPYNLGWLKTEVYDKARLGDPDFNVVQFASTMNPSFPPEELERIKRSGIPAWKIRMFYEGLFDQPPGLIYATYIDQYREFGGHLVRPFPVNEYWPRFVGVDFGGTNCAKIYAAQDPTTGLFYLYHESLTGHKTAKQHVEDILQTLAGSPLYGVWGGARSEESWRLEFAQAGLPISEPDTYDLEVGIDRAVGLFTNNRVLVFDAMRGLRDELATYSRPVAPDGTVMDGIVDKSLFHRLDALRYLSGGIAGYGMALPILALGSAKGWQPRALR